MIVYRLPYRVSQYSTLGTLGGHRVETVFLVAEIPISSLYLPGGMALAAIAMLGYMIIRFRGGAEFTVVDATILAVAVAILGAAAVPLVETTSQQAKTSALLQSLHALRSQIELYKLEHGGVAPVLHEGGLPQLVRSTDASGTPGPAGKKHPYGPYLQSGIPVNPITGRSVVTATESFPPAGPSGNGGWAYHPATGQVAVDLEDFLER